MVRPFLVLGAALVLTWLALPVSAQGEQPVVLNVRGIDGDFAPLLPERPQSFAFEFAVWVPGLSICPNSSIDVNFKVSQSPPYATVALERDQASVYVDSLSALFFQDVTVKTAMHIMIPEGAPAHDVGQYELQAQAVPRGNSMSGCMLAPSEVIRIPIHLINAYIYGLDYEVSGQQLLVHNKANGQTKVDIAWGYRQTGTIDGPSFTLEPLGPKGHEVEPSASKVLDLVNSDILPEWDGRVRIRAYDAAQSDSESHEEWITLFPEESPETLEGVEQPLHAAPGLELAMLLPAVGVLLRRRRA